MVCPKNTPPSSLVDVVKADQVIKSHDTNIHLASMVIIVNPPIEFYAGKLYQQRGRLLTDDDGDERNSYFWVTFNFNALHSVPYRDIRTVKPF